MFLFEFIFVRRRGVIRFERVLGLFFELFDLGSVFVLEFDDDDEDDDDEDLWDVVVIVILLLLLDWDFDLEYDLFFLKCLILMDFVVVRVV